METKYLLNLEKLTEDFGSCYGVYIGNRVIFKDSLQKNLKGSIGLFAHTAAKLKRRPIINIDRDVDYRHWGALNTWTDQKKGIDPDIRESLQHLCTTLLDIADTIDAPPYDDKQYAYLYLLARRSYNICRGKEVACEYDEWKRGHFDNNLGENQYLNFVDETIEKLLNSGVFNGVRSNASKQDINNYLEDFDFEGCDSKQKKIMLKLYCRFRSIYYKRNGMYSVNMANVGRLIFRLKKEPDQLEALLHFDYLLNLINADIDTLHNASRVNSICGDIDFSHLPCRFSDEEVRASGIKQHAKVVLAVMDHMQGKAESKSYWLGFFCVLLKRGWIEDNLAGFCSKMNALFNLELNSRDFSRAKNRYVTNVEEWEEGDSRIQKKKEFALRFKALIDFYLDYRKRMALTN